MDLLQKYLKDNYLRFKVLSDFDIEINEKIYHLIYPQEGKLFDENFHLITDDSNCDFYVFNFGGDWYYVDYFSVKSPILNELRYLGTIDSPIESTIFLGIRGGFEILNGSREYEDWCKKALFLESKILGICEKNTLAGVLKFQLACQKVEIKPIIGATYTVHYRENIKKYDIKCYVKNEQGWQNLLMINKEVNVINQKFIYEDRLFELTEGLIFVFDPKSIDYRYIWRRGSVETYYQLDTVEFIDQDFDKWYLNNLKKFVRSDISPVAIYDAFYLDKDHAHIKKVLNNISGIYEYESRNQYFKSYEKYLSELEMLFGTIDNSYLTIAEKALLNLQIISDNCNFIVPTSEFHLPDYILTEEQLKDFKNKTELFWSLIEQGMKEKVSDKNWDEYLDRVQLEYSVIIKGNKLIDYFLILWDIVDYCDKNKILVGVGRGSSGGSLIAYLLGITNLDPIKYKLLFERFLNENRLEKSLPDIDTDFEGNRRNEVKSYMENRFGINSVCSVGTYMTFKLKTIFTDLARMENVPVQEVKIMTKILGDGEKNGTDWTEIFQLASQSDKLRSFIKKHPDIVNNAKLCLMQPRSSSVHACATIITPIDKEIYNWFPVKKMKTKDNETILVSEWEGIQLDKAGFLKEDILGILQLDKFANIIKLIKENKEIEIDFKSIPMNDLKVFSYFSKGWNNDTFQFGAKGLSKYTQSLQPNSIEELSAANALFRPGAMDSNAHNDFILIKFGKKEVEYDYMLEDITKETYGLYIYQEQIMLAAKILGGFSLTEADAMRSIMFTKGKKQFKDQFYIYRNKFIEGAIKNNCDKNIAENIWNKLEAFAGYGFNKSHAVAYAITGYISQYLKVHYPLEFWTTAFELIDNSKKEEILPQYISEINQTGSIKLSSPDINYSQREIYSDSSLNTIYWAINSIKQVGGIATEQIITERDKNGKYFSFDEFLSRHIFKGSKVNKTHIENLVYSGAFDDIEGIIYPSDRKHLIELYYTKNKIKIDKDSNLLQIAGKKVFEDWWWSLQQRILSGLATFDYKDICNNTLSIHQTYIEQSNFQSNDFVLTNGCTGGYILEVVERVSKKKGKWCSIWIDSNSVLLNVIIFPEQYESLLKANIEFIGSEGSLLIFSGQLAFDTYRKENTMRITKDSEIYLLN